MPQIAFSNPFEGNPTEMLNPLSVLSFIQQMRRQQEVKEKEGRLDMYAAQAGSGMAKEFGVDLPAPTNYDEFRILASVLPGMVEQKRRKEAEGVLGTSLEAFGAERDKLSLDKERASMDPRAMFRGLSGARGNIESLLSGYTETPEDEPAERYLRDALMSAVDLTPDSSLGELDAGTRNLTNTLGDLTKFFPRDFSVKSADPFADIPGPALEKFPELRPYITVVKSLEDEVGFMEKRVMDSLIFGKPLDPTVGKLLDSKRTDLNTARTTLDRAYQGMIKGRTGHDVEMPPVPTTTNITRPDFSEEEMKSALSEARTKLKGRSKDEILEYAEFLMQKRRGNK